MTGLAEPEELAQLAELAEPEELADEKGGSGERWNDMAELICEVCLWSWLAKIASGIAGGMAAGIV